MAEETITMTQNAVDRLAVVQQVTNRQLRQYEAARQLGLSIRQVKVPNVRDRSGQGVKFKNGERVEEHSQGMAETAIH